MKQGGKFHLFLTKRIATEFFESCFGLLEQSDRTMDLSSGLLLSKQKSILSSSDISIVDCQVR